MTAATLPAWALYPWFGGDDADIVHPGDIDKFRQLMPYGKVFAIVGEGEGFVVLRYGPETFRVKPKLLRAVPAPPFVFGQRVREREGERIGAVADIRWHWGRERPFFHLTVDGKWNKKRLWEEDLVACDDAYR